jgi:hypothetical protein
MTRSHDNAVPREVNHACVREGIEYKRTPRRSRTFGVLPHSRPEHTKVLPYFATPAMPETNLGYKSTR